MSSRQENVKWVDGLRGIASLLVVFTHLARSFDEDLFKPTSAEGEVPRVAQWPIIRILFQGRIGVTIFALVTGYVCALKPIRQCRAGNQETMFIGISKSAFRRVPRLVLPTTIATTLIWFFCQIGTFKVGNKVDSWWINYTSPNVTPIFGEAAKSLIYNLVTTWTRSSNVYDTNQWTLQPLLKGSMLVYAMLVATAYAKPLYRMMIELGLFIYYYAGNDSFGMQFFFGAFLSDLSQHPGHIAWCQARKWPSQILSPILIFSGLLLASYPEHGVLWVRWSEILSNASIWLFPQDNETSRFYSALGLECIALGIHFSPSIKSLLSHKYLLWFGKNSFAVYLLHGTLLRTVLVWMFFGFTVPTDIVHEDGIVQPAEHLRLCGNKRFFFWLPVWFVVLYSVANMWTRYVDLWCARVTESLVRYVLNEQQREVDFEKTVLPH